MNHRTAALNLAKNRWRVFPIVARGKEPLMKNYLERATTDPNVINGWWSSRPYNIGGAAGKKSGFWVLDIDGEEGEQTLREWEAEHGSLPPTVEAITGSGRHAYFRWPTGIEIRNTQCRTDMPGIDVRGNGGYVICPPSIHPSGRQYRWSVESADSFADAPDWLIARIKRKGGNGEAAAMSPEAWRTFVGTTTDGSRRGAAIARLSGLLLRRYLDPLMALDLIRLFNAARCEPPLDDGEVVRIVTDICQRELQRREDRS